MEISEIAAFILWALLFLYSVILHEISHGVAALILGDTTAKRAGRLTLNPFRHLDFSGTVLMPAMVWFVSHGRFIFGMAKPVPVNFAALRNPKRDMIFVAIAGPLTNLAIAWVMALIYSHTNLSMFLIIAYLNLALAAFNLLPIPPLDGSKALAGLLPLSLSRIYLKLEPFGMVVILILYFSGIIQHLIVPVMNGLMSVYHLPDLYTSV